MHAWELRKEIRDEIFDYGLLMSKLSTYAQPRKKISRWLAQGDIVRIKKGLYVFGPKIALHPYSKERLANLIYGPSVLSLEYALSHYGLIPERVETLTSITTKKSKLFNTPVGPFSYRFLRTQLYACHCIRHGHGQNTFFIASPEKALADKLFFLSDKLLSCQHMENYLKDDLRIDEQDLLSLNVEKNALHKPYSFDLRKLSKSYALNGKLSV